MTKITGLAGLRPSASAAKRITCPPYDVIKPGTKLEALLQENLQSMYHVVLGDQPVRTLEKMKACGDLITDTEEAFYVYEQCYGEKRRIGVLAAVEVSAYEEKQVIRHEKTFDSKVQGRIKLMEETGYITEPIWLLTPQPIGALLEAIAEKDEPVYAFTSDFQGESELSGIANRVFRVPAQSAQGKQLAEMVSKTALYIADGHHRYHSALRMGLDRCIAYLCEAGHAHIQAYNRVIKGKASLATIKDQLPLQEESAFTTPQRHQFQLYTREGCFSYRVTEVDEDDVVGRLDCRLLEKTLYPLLGLGHEMIHDPAFFDYYPEQDLAAMESIVERGTYDLAVALHPVSAEELMAVADAGIVNPEIVMPEKSTFFAPKILSGLILIPTKG